MRSYVEEFDDTLSNRSCDYYTFSLACLWILLQPGKVCYEDVALTHQRVFLYAGGRMAFVKHPVPFSITGE